MDSPCIYILYWDIDCPYIGQTTNIKKRTNVHFNSLRRGDHCNYKLQDTYNKIGDLPYVEVLVNCSISELNDLEERYIQEFDAINNGLNIISGGCSVGYGVNNPASKYTEEQLVLMLKLLTDVNNSYKDIINATGIGKDTITKVVNGSHHVWLKEKYPELYNSMLEVSTKARYKNSASAAKQGKKYRKIKDPQGNIYEVTNTLQFSKDHGLSNGNLCSVLLGKRHSVSGWYGVDE